MISSTVLESFEHLLPRLRRLLGSDGVIVEPDRLLAYESDALTYLRGTPLAVLLPRSPAQLRAVLRLLHRARIPFVPRGAGTGISGGAVAREAVILSTMRMNRILGIDPADRLATVEPGVATGQIDAAAMRHGLAYLPDPASSSACTIGGNIAENAGGPHCLKHGVTTDHVRELEVALPDGENLTLGRGADGGLDLAGLFIGSEGTFGLATRIALRLVRRTPAVRTALALFDRMEEAAGAVSELLSSGVLPVAIEMIDGRTIRMVEESAFAVGLPLDLAAVLLIEVEGLPEEVEEDIERAVAVARAAGAREVRAARDETERTRLWQARKRAFGALGRRAPEVLVQDAVVPRSAIAVVLERIDEIARRHDLVHISYFHAGDGNLHPHLLFDRRDADQVRRVGLASKEIMRLCVEAGGTITGEHGVGLDKRGSMPLVFSPSELEVLERLKRAFDPDGLCNPGKVLPDGLPRSPEPATGG
ncbi:MAG: FAD-binding oxidoreductase [Gemmatimonadota bacterium]